jgi:hypothetical protein
VGVSAGLLFSRTTGQLAEPVRAVLFGLLLRERLAPPGLEPARQEEITEELGQHLDDARREAMTRGLTPAEAERAGPSSRA